MGGYQDIYRLSGFEDQMRALLSGAPAAASYLDFGDHSFTIALLPMGWQAGAEVRAVADALMQWLRVRVITMKPIEIPEEALLGEVVDTGPVMDRLFGHLPDEADRVMALAEQPLVSRAHGGCYGIASVFDCIGMSSIARLREVDHRRPPNLALEARRLTMVVLHELGHTFGLPHCEVRDCLMLAGEGRSIVKEFDETPPHFCPRCWSRVVAGLRISRTSARGHFLRAGALMRHGRAREAIVEYSAALAKTPLDAMLWNDTGIAHFRAGSRRNAEHALEHAIELARSSRVRVPQPFYNFAILLRSGSGGEAEALRFFEEGVKLDSNGRDACAYAGRIYHEVFRRDDLAKYALALARELNAI